jgi:glucoamylase
MIRRALSFLVRHGPVSEQDRWEEDAGLNTFTLAVCVAALVAGAALLEAEARELALAFADYWNAQLEEWTTVRDTPLARLYGVPGYYVRVAPGESLYDDRCPRDRVLPIRNLAVDPSLPASAQVSVDFLQLVRFGLRRPDDALIVASIKVADALLKVQTPSGACWHRYNEDGYGEHDDGSAYDGTGRGRAWPLLCGERGHYELCAGRDPLPYLQAMARMVSAGGMLPEQIWDAAPIPARGLMAGIDVESCVGEKNFIRRQQCPIHQFVEKRGRRFRAKNPRHASTVLSGHLELLRLFPCVGRWPRRERRSGASLKRP